MVIIDLRGQENKMLYSSLQIAERFGKKHSAVLKDIRNLDCSKKFHKLNFKETQLTVDLGNGKTRKTTAFMMTRDGFLYLIMGYSDPEAIKIKIAFVQEYNAMSRICDMYQV